MFQPRHSGVQADITTVFLRGTTIKLFRTEIFPRHRRLCCWALEAKGSAQTGRCTNGAHQYRADVGPWQAVPFVYLRGRSRHHSRQPKSFLLSNQNRFAFVERKSHATTKGKRVRRLQNLKQKRRFPNAEIPHTARMAGKIKQSSANFSGRFRSRRCALRNDTKRRNAVLRPENIQNGQPAANDTQKRQNTYIAPEAIAVETSAGVMTGCSMLQNSA